MRGPKPKTDNRTLVFAELPDEELVTRSRAGESTATEYLLEKYKYMARGKAKLLHILGGDSDDLMQEAMIGLFGAIRDYDADKGASFQTFANLCITRQLYKAVQASNRKKHRPLNQAISLDEPAAEKKEDGAEGKLLDTLMRGLSPEEELIAQENTVLELYLDGMDYTEIAKKLGRKDKSIDNALQRIRMKIRKLY